MFTSAHASLRIDLAHTTKADFLKGARRAKNAVPLHGLGDLAYSEYMAGEFISVWQRGVWIGAYYHDDYVKLDEGWKIQRTGYTYLFHEEWSRADLPSLRVVVPA